MRALARDVRVEPGGGSLGDHRARAARHDPHAPHPLGPERHQPRGRGPERGGELLAERGPGRVQLAPHTDPHPVLFPELAAHRDAEPARQHRVVADLRMKVQRQVRTVERDALSDEPGRAPIPGPRERFQPAPEQPVMNQQQIRPLLRRHANRRLAQVHRRSDPGDLAPVRDLQPVQGLRGVRDLPHAQVVVQIGHEPGEVHQVKGGDSMETLFGQIIDSAARFPHG